jgi:hypothetical protein
MRALFIVVLSALIGLGPVAASAQAVSTMVSPVFNPVQSSRALIAEATHDLNFAQRSFRVPGWQGSDERSIPGFTPGDMGAGTFLSSADSAGVVYPFSARRTNSIRNSSMVGAAAGSPGTLPTNWVNWSAATGLAWAVAGTGTEAGLPYIDLRLSGTAVGAASSTIRFDAINTIAATASQAWVYSAYSRLAAGSGGNVSQAILVGGSSTNGTTVAAAFTTPNLSLGSSLARVTGAGTTAASTTHVVPYIQIGTVAGAVDITVRIAAPQLETGSVATQYIPTTSAAVTVTDLIRTNLGAEVWEARSNNVYPSIPNSAPGGSNNWARNWNGVNSTITLNDRAAPDGTTTATKVVTNGANEGVFYRSTTLPSANADWTASTWVYSEAGATIQVGINASGGTAWTSTTFVNHSVPAGVWTRLSLTRTAAASVTASSITWSVLTPLSGGTFWVWENSFGPGSFATPGIVTAGSAVTRSAPSITYAGLQSVFSSPTGWIVVVFKRNATGAYARLLDASGPTFIVAPDGTLQFSLDAAVNSAVTANALTVGARTVAAAAWDGVSLSVAMNGGAVGTGTYVLGTVGAVNIGNRSALDRALNGQIERIIAGTGAPPAALNVLTSTPGPLGANDNFARMEMYG